MKNVYEKAVAGAEQAIRLRLDENDTILKAAQQDGGRDLTDDERETISENVRLVRGPLQDQLKTAQADLKAVEESRELGRSIGPSVPSVDASVKSEPQDRYFQNMQAGNKSLGDAFIESAGYKQAIDQYRSSGRLESGFSTGPVSLEMKGTLLEGSSSPGSGSGGGMLTVPQVVPGVVDTLFQRLTVADLFLSGQTSGNTIRYVVEGTATSGAAGVAEAGTKPESTLGLGTRDEPVKKIATILPISEEMLEDAPAIQSYINGRLALFVRIEEERQLIRGTSGGAEVQGLLTSRSVPVYGGGTAAGNRAEQLFKAMNGMRGSAFVEPDWIVISPSDWEAIRLLKDTANQYYGGGPFLGPYGGPQGPVSATGQLTGANDSIWGKAVYVTGALGAGTAVVGSRDSAQVFRRGGISVEATNSHSNYFQLNLVAIRAEERLALAVYRPPGFVEVRLA
jgi:HK97 family phage major capsid protein